MSETYSYIFWALLDATYTTIGITVGAAILGLALGFLVALARLYGPGWLRAVAVVYVEAFRNTPILVQLFLIYFGLVPLGVQVGPMTAAVVGLGLNGAALVSEVFRSSILAVDRGQTEAGVAIGLTPAATLFLIVVPQSLRIAIPSLGNFTVSLMKDTSLASAVAVTELSFRARNLVSETFLSTEIYLLVALIYLVLGIPVAAFFEQLRKSYEVEGNRHA
ncbi:MAG: amino acid ABC transporter permease [Sphingomonadales bacterium]|nr:MAG: amino acid ABC transporter permease [Sphingomonadales bacterium]